MSLEQKIRFHFPLEEELRTFYVLNIPSENIPQFQQRVSAFPATPEFTSLPESATNTFQRRKGNWQGAI